MLALTLPLWHGVNNLWELQISHLKWCWSFQVVKWKNNGGFRTILNMRQSKCDWPHISSTSAFITGLAHSKCEFHISGSKGDLAQNLKHQEIYQQTKKGVLNMAARQLPLHWYQSSTCFTVLVPGLWTGSWDRHQWFVTSVNNVLKG